MEVCNPKGGGIAAPTSILAMLLMIMMLLNAYCCGAVVLAKSNTSFRYSDGCLDECLIEEDLELELEFLMNPYVSRILDGGQVQKPQSGNPNAPACGTEKDSFPYRSCIDKIKNPRNKHGCDPKGLYRNSCQPPKTPN